MLHVGDVFRLLLIFNFTAFKRNVSTAATSDTDSDSVSTSTRIPVSETRKISFQSHGVLLTTDEVHCDIFLPRRDEMRYDESEK
jgi:hypothetical protein